MKGLYALFIRPGYFLFILFIRPKLKDNEMRLRDEQAIIWYSHTAWQKHTMTTTPDVDIYFIIGINNERLLFRYVYKTIKRL